MIKLQDIHKTFENNHVLRGIDLDIGEGQTMVILGKSGCGKSVLLKLILRLLDKDQGRIIIDDEDTTEFLRRSNGAGAQKDGHVVPVGGVVRFAHGRG